MAPMKHVELWRWRYYDPLDRKYHICHEKMTEADARRQFPDGADKVPGTLEPSYVLDVAALLRSAKAC